MAGGSTKPQFYTGAIVIQPAAALDDFVRVAAPGNEFVYCAAPEPQRLAEGWLRAGELARTGLIRTHERRRAGGGREYYAVRTTRPLPRETSPQEKVLAERATAAIFRQLKRSANLGLPCASDEELARYAGLATRNAASGRVRKLIAVGLIRSELVYDHGVPARVVTIVETGKFTALPRKWALLKEAAEREQRSAGGAK